MVVISAVKRTFGAAVGAMMQKLEEEEEEPHAGREVEYVKHS
jgi:hypothetical protein